MKVAMIQMLVVAGQIAMNRIHGLKLVEQAASKANVIVLPEVWTSGYALRNVEEIAEDFNGPTITGLREIAKGYKVHIISGSLPMRINGKVFNTAVVIDDSGAIVDNYQKLHLFSMFNEEKFFAPGTKRCEVICAGIKSGLAICYDLRFPELFRAMALGGVKITYLPAEWPSARGDNWRLLVQARAVENQMYMCAVNCIGEYKGGPFYGHSMLVSPTGEILIEGASTEEILYGDVSEELVDKTRGGMSVLKDVRADMYR